MAKTARRKRPVQEEQEDGTCCRINAAATRLFADKGYDGTSTKEICDLAGVNIAAIHYHFGSKEGLLRHIMERYGASSLESVQRILAPPANHDELKVRLQMFLEDAIEPFLQQPDLCRIVQAEIELMHARSEDVFRRTFLKRFETLIGFLSHAKKRRLIAKGVNPQFAARCLFSQIAHQTRTDSIYRKFYGISLHQAAYRTTWVQQTLHIFLEGVSA